MNESRPITVVCVLRSGGDYGPGYVANLERQVMEHMELRLPLFVCHTDMTLNNPGVFRQELEQDWTGWWSKLEMFRTKGPCLYLDLDTSIFANLNYVTQALWEVEDKGEKAFWMLESFRYRRGVAEEEEQWASGIMAWTGDWSGLTEGFVWDEEQKLLWDQRWISREVARDTEIRPIRELCGPILSYKQDCLKNSLSRPSIVCFHGQPRPHKVGRPYFG